MKVKNMTSSNGNTIANQFILSETGNGANGNFVKKEVFQSYDSIICEYFIDKKHYGKWIEIKSIYSLDEAKRKCEELGIKNKIPHRVTNKTNTLFSFYPKKDGAIYDYSTS